MREKKKEGRTDGRKEGRKEGKEGGWKVAREGWREEGGREGWIDDWLIGWVVGWLGGWLVGWLKADNVLFSQLNLLKFYDLFFYSVDGSFSEWSTGSFCSRSCGSGRRMRFRTCTNPSPSFGGKECDGSFAMMEQCHQRACDGEFLCPIVKPFRPLRWLPNLL